MNKMCDATFFQPKTEIIVWVVTDGKAGMENQCLGLAEALILAMGGRVKTVVKRIKLRFPWRHLVPYFLKWLSLSFSNKGDSIAAPWPDVLISCGRQSLAASIYVHEASRSDGWLGTLTVHIQTPACPLNLFDLLIVPEHDNVSGENVFTTKGSLHRINHKVLMTESVKWARQVAHLPRPLVTVLVGGSNAVYKVTPEICAKLGRDLSELAQKQGIGLLVTTSRRTGAANEAALREGLKDAPAFIWDGQGDNPYFGFLGLADAIIVTGDSVNMVTEACSTGKAVYVVDLPGGSPKFNNFHAAMRQSGFAQPFEGVIDYWHCEPPNDTVRAANKVKDILLAHMGKSYDGTSSGL